MRRALKAAGVTGVDDDLNDGLSRFFKRSGGKNGDTPPPAGT